MWSSLQPLFDDTVRVCSFQHDLEPTDNITSHVRLQAHISKKTKTRRGHTKGCKTNTPLSHVPNFSWAWLPSFADDSAGPLAQKHLKTAPRVPAKFPEPCKWPTRCPQSSNMPNMIHTVPGPSPVTLLPMILVGTSHEDFPRNINGNGLPWCSIRCEVALTLPPEFSERNSNKHFFGARPQ